MDETGFQVGIPAGEEVIVPITAFKLYTPSLENRVSIVTNVLLRSVATECCYDVLLQISMRRLESSSPRGPIFRAHYIAIKRAMRQCRCSDHMRRCLIS
jgi:hypothetical protein